MISVIIPAYNSALFLAEAVESVRNQTVDDWELILVDDGSTDSTPAICDSMAAIDSRIRVIHKQNGGPSEARNAGIGASEGEWLAFLDADDALTPDAFSTMLEAARRHDADLVAAHLVRSPDSHLPASIPVPYAEETLSPETAVQRILYQSGLNNSMRGKLFSRRLWDNLHFRRGTWYEDLDIFYRVIARANRVAAIPDVVYIYRENPDSFTHRFSEARSDVLDVCDRMVDYMEACSPALLPAARDRRLSAAFNIFGLLSANPDALTYVAHPSSSDASASPVPPAALPTRRQQLISRCRAIILDQRRRSLFDPKVRLKNKLGILATYIGGFTLLRLLTRRAYR